MIVRNWMGVAQKERADEYINHLQQDTFKKLAGIKGFLKASILKREVNEGTEFLITTEWESLDAIRQFAGDDYDTAVVPPLVQDLMVWYEDRVRHYTPVP